MANYSDYGGGGGKVGGGDYFPTYQPDQAVETRKRAREEDSYDYGKHDIDEGSHAKGGKCGGEEYSYGDGDIGEGPAKRAKTESSGNQSLDNPLSKALMNFLTEKLGKDVVDQIVNEIRGKSSGQGVGDGDIGGDDDSYGGDSAAYAQQPLTPPLTPVTENAPVSKLKADLPPVTQDQVTPPTPPATPPATPTGETPPALEQKTVDGSNGTSKASGSNGASDAGKSIPVSGGGENTINLTNSGSQPQSYALFVNPGPGMTASFDRPDGFVTLQPGESANFKLPAGYGGYVQQMNNYTQQDYDNHVKPEADNFKATRAEYKFDADGQLWFNNSNIDGYNASLKMSSDGNSASVGGNGSVLDKIAAEHPELVKTVGGQKVIEGPQFFSDAINGTSVEEFNKFFNQGGATNTYVLPDDNLAMRHANSNTLDLEFGDA